MNKTIYNGSAIESALLAMKAKENKFFSYRPELYYTKKFGLICQLLSEFEKTFQIHKQTKLVALSYLPFTSFYRVDISARSSRAFPLTTTCMRLTLSFAC